MVTFIASVNDCQYISRSSEMTMGFFALPNAVISNVCRKHRSYLLF